MAAAGVADIGVDVSGEVDGVEIATTATIDSGAEDRGERSVGMGSVVNFAISRSRSSTAAAQISGSVSIGFGPQNDVSSNIL